MRMLRVGALMSVAALVASQPLVAQQVSRTCLAVRPASGAEGRWLDMDVRFGHLEFEVHDGSDVEVLPPRAGGGGSERANCRVDPRTGRILIRQTPLAPGAFESVDALIRVPRHMNVKVHVSQGGDLSMTGIVGDVEISVLNGSVSLEHMAGSAVVDAGNGSITAVFDAVTPGTPMSFSTFNGTVNVTFPSAVKADVRASATGGVIRNDFDLSPLEPRLNGGAGRSHELMGRINGGGPDFYFHTLNGDVVLHLR